MKRIAAVIALTLVVAPVALAKPPTVEERVEARRARAEAREEQRDEEREERRRVQQAKRSARDLDLEGAAKRRYIDLHRSR